MSEINWAKNVITNAYPNISKDKGADLDRNGKIAGNEVLVDKNKNGVVGDNEDFLAYLDRNSAILQAKIPFIGNGAGLSPENRIHQLLHMESELYSPQNIKLAYDKLTTIVNVLKDRLTGEYAHRSMEDKILLCHQLIKALGYEYTNSDNPLITDNLLRSQLDCDTSSFVILALADELKKEQPEWTALGIVTIPNHAFLEYKGKYFDYGDQNSWLRKEDYIKEYNLPTDKKLLKNMFRTYYGQEIVSVFYINRGVYWSSRGEYDKAIDDYTKALEMDPDISMALNNRGNALIIKKEYDKALTDLTKALRINPKASNAYSNRGIAWTGKKEYDKAIADYSRALELDPKYTNAWFNRGNAWFYKGEYNKALDDYYKTLELNPAHQNAKTNLKICLDKVQ